MQQHGQIRTYTQLMTASNILLARQPVSGSTILLNATGKQRVSQAQQQLVLWYMSLQLTEAWSES